MCVACLPWGLLCTYTAGRCARVHTSGRACLSAKRLCGVTRFSCTNIWYNTRECAACSGAAHGVPVRGHQGAGHAHVGVVERGGECGGCAQTLVSPSLRPFPTAPLPCCALPSLRPSPHPLPRPRSKARCLRPATPTRRGRSQGSAWCVEAGGQGMGQWVWRGGIGGGDGGSERHAMTMSEVQRRGLWPRRCLLMCAHLCC